MGREWGKERGAYNAAMIKRIISGGQTGVDRAALDWAIANGIQHGGWCPAGREAEDGAIPAKYQLQEIAGGYQKRTRANVSDSDATLIISLAEELTGGTFETRKYAVNIGKPWLHMTVGALRSPDGCEIHPSLSSMSPARGRQRSLTSGPSLCRCWMRSGPIPQGLEPIHNHLHRVARHAIE